MPTLDELLTEQEGILRDCRLLLKRLGKKFARLAEALKQIAVLEPGCSTAELCEDRACNVARKLAREALEGER